MSENNDKSKTEVFDPFTEEKPIVRRAENDAYSRARSSAYQDDYYEDDEEIKEKRGLTFLIIIITVLLCGAIIWGAYIFTTIDKDKRENLQSDTTTETEVAVEETEEEEEPEEEIVVKPDVVSYKIAFQKGTVEEEGGKYTVRVNLYDSSMNKTGSKRLVIDESTEIREGTEKMSLSSFVYILKSLGSEAFVCDARVDEKNGVLVSVSYSKKDVEVKEEEQKEETEKTEEKAEQNSENEEVKTEENNNSEEINTSEENQPPEEQTPSEETTSEESSENVASDETTVAHD